MKFKRAIVDDMESRFQIEALGDDKMEKTEADTLIETLDQISSDLVQSLSNLHSISIQPSMARTRKDVQAAQLEVIVALNGCVMKMDGILMSSKRQAR